MKVKPKNVFFYHSPNFRKLHSVRIESSRNMAPYCLNTKKNMSIEIS